MQYVEGCQGRVFVVKLDHQDDLKKSLEDIVSKENIIFGCIHCMGAIKKSKVVVGPESESLPPKPVYESLSNPHEVVAFGTIAWSNEKPHIHMHAVLSNNNHTVIGCIREFSEIFIVMEVIIYEIINVKATRRKDEKVGLTLLSFE